MEKTTDACQVMMVDPSTNGGICQYTFALCRGLAQRGVKVKLLTQARGKYELGHLGHAFAIERVLIPPRERGGRLTRPLMRRAAPGFYPKRFAGELVKRLRRAGAQLLHQQWLIDSPEVDGEIWDEVRRGYDIPLVYTAHNVLPHESASGQADAYGKLYQRPSKIIVHGQALAEQARRELMVPADKLHVIHQGNSHWMREVSPPASARDARAQLGINENVKVILAFGFIRHYKGLDVLLLSLKSLLKDKAMGPVLVLAVGTGGRQIDEFHEGLSAALKLGDSYRRVRDYVAIEDFAKYFCAADVVCLPYRDGTNSGTLQLAYSYAKPVVITRVGSLAEAVLAEETGEIVEPEDPDGLADALHRLLMNPKRAQEMGRRGYEWSETQLSWDAAAAETIKVYDLK
jgi:glycosyltransferase involved in cell wall biosynthesis